MSLFTLRAPEEVDGLLRMHLKAVGRGPCTHCVDILHQMDHHIA